MKDIAIIGYSGVFPGANSVKDFAENLKNSTVSIGKVPEDRLYDTSISKNISYCNGGFLDNISNFDHQFFNIPLGEAEQITPHQRLLLQEAYKTFEHAYYSMQDLKGTNTSVYVGDTSTEYYLLAKQTSPSLIAGNMKSLNASRISRFFDLRGAAYNIDTTCSSSLSALGIASKDLYLDQTDLALVCGVNIQIFPQQVNSAIQMGVESASGKCSPFSSEADGTLLGETVVCVLLKRLDKAIKAGDTIHGVIRSIELNQDGASSSSITAPSSIAQTAVIQAALEKSGVSPREVTFIEAHGTGTKLGDPIEIEGLSNVFSDNLAEGEYINISTVKSNIGHTNSAAGLSGLIKVLLSFKHNILYPSANCLPLNEFIDFEDAKVRVLESPDAWDNVKRTERKIAGISSFGLMGTNVHAILEDYNPNCVIADFNKEDNFEYAFCISAKSGSSLSNYIDEFIKYLKNTKDEISEISRAINIRQIFDYRLSIRAKSKSELIQKLKNNKEHFTIDKSKKENIIFLFDDGLPEESEIAKAISDYFPELNHLIKLCASHSQTALLLQYLTYQLILKTGVNTTDMLGYGLSKIVIRIIKNEISIEDALSEIDNIEYENELIDNLYYRAIKLLDSYNVKVTFISIGHKGTLGNIFEALSKENKCNFLTIDYVNCSARDLSVEGLFGLTGIADLKPLYGNMHNPKIALPSYVFDSIRCWLRDQDDVLENVDTLQPQLIEHKHDIENGLEGLDISEQLKILWQEVLKTPITSDCDFFEMGGHSLNGQQLINRINDLFKTDFDIDTLFEYGSPGEMANHISILMKSELVNIEQDSIESVGIQTDYEASFAQKRLWLSSILTNNSSSLNISETFIAEGDLNVEKLISAFELLINRHESLRTNFVLNQDGIRQKICTLEELGFKVQTDNMQGVLEEKVKAQILKFHESPFNLHQGSLIRALIYKISQNKHIISFTIHHLICDGWSVGIIRKELLYIYNCLCNNTKIELPKLDVQYKDYTAWLIKKSKTSEFQFAEDYWLNKFSTIGESIDLKYYNNRPKVKTYNGSIKTFDIPAKLYDGIKDIVSSKGVTLTMTLGALINVLIYKLSNKSDITIGLPIVERNNKLLENQVGLYLNTIPYRMQWESKDTFLNLLERSSTILKEAYKNKFYPFELLVDKLKLKTNPSRFPLFDVVLSVQNFINLDVTSQQPNDMTSLKFESLKLDDFSAAQFDIAYRFVEDKDRLYYEIEYNTDLFSPEIIADYNELLVSIMNQCLFNKEIPISQVLNASEENFVKQHKIILDKTPKANITGNILDSLVDVFAKFPNHVAVSWEGNRMTYSELESMSNKFSNYLLDKNNLKPKDAVVLSIDVSPMLIVGVLGILKAGLVYVPLDKNIPDQRQSYIKTDVKARLTIDDEWINTFLEEKERISSQKPSIQIDHNQLAYIIYTSGSTGKPKGVMVSHANVLELMINCNDAHFDFNPSDIWTLYHNYSFDFSIWEIFGPLFTGGQLLLIPRHKTIDFNYYLDQIKKAGVSVLNFTPRVFQEFDNVRQLLNEECPKVRYLIFGGDLLVPNILKNWNHAHPSCKIINMFGITEITVHGTFKELKISDINNKGGLSNIGKPLQGFMFYLFDESQRLTKEGEVGEMYIGGNQLALGYFNNPDITEKQFINEKHYGLGRLYKSGDLARQLPNGDLEYIGRMDDQVSLNGFRVELNEIKLALLSINEIEQAFVSIYKKGESIHLVAYFKSITPISEKQIKESLKTQLPHYMVPAFYISVKEFETNNNGKIDTSKLPEVFPEINDKEELNTDYKQEIKNKVRMIFCKVLEVSKVNESEDFFELGGSSLQLVRLHMELEKEWPQKLLISDLFEYNTVIEISDYLKKSNTPDKVLENSGKSDVKDEVDFLEI